MPPLGHFSLIRFGKVADGAAGAQSEAAAPLSQRSAAG
jgi:hypothetical protein